MQGRSEFWNTSSGENLSLALSFAMPILGLFFGIFLIVHGVGDSWAEECVKAGGEFVVDQNWVDDGSDDGRVVVDERCEMP